MKKDFPGSILFNLANFSTSLTGSAPGERIKNIGIVASESSTEDDNTSEKFNFESISTNYSPEGSAPLMKLVNADVIRSGLKHLRTSNFLNGI